MLPRCRGESAAARVLGILGQLTARTGDATKALELVGESLAKLRVLGDARNALPALRSLAMMAHDAGNAVHARAYARELLEQAQALGSTRQTVGALTILGRGTALLDGDAADATLWLEGSVEGRTRRSDLSAPAGTSLTALGEAATLHGDYVLARTYLVEALQRQRAKDIRRVIPVTLQRLAGHSRRRKVRHDGRCNWRARRRATHRGCAGDGGETSAGRAHVGGSTGDADGGGTGARGA